MNSKTIKRLIALRQFKSPQVKNMIEIETKLSITMPGNILGIHFYLSIFEDLIRKDPDKSINISMDALDLFGMAEAMKELSGKNVSSVEFRHYSGGGSKGKWIDLVKKGDIYYINFATEQKRRISLPLDRWRFLGMAKALLMFVNSGNAYYDDAIKDNEKIKATKKKRGEE